MMNFNTSKMRSQSVMAMFDHFFRLTRSDTSVL